MSDVIHPAHRRDDRDELHGCATLGPAMGDVHATAIRDHWRTR
jgi:hypothetical protein